jgi:hypothetical protein
MDFQRGERKHASIKVDFPNGTQAKAWIKVWAAIGYEIQVRYSAFIFAWGTNHLLFSAFKDTEPNGFQPIYLVIFSSFSKLFKLVIRILPTESLFFLIFTLRCKNIFVCKKN